MRFSRDPKVTHKVYVQIAHAIISQLSSFSAVPQLVRDIEVYKS